MDIIKSRNILGFKRYTLKLQIMKLNKLQLIAFIFFIGASVSCKEIVYVDETVEETDKTEEAEEVADKDPREGLADWATETHTKDGVIDYSIVFAQNQVNRIDIVLSASEYASMQSEMASLSGSVQQGPGCDFPDGTPSYVACDFFFNGVQWYEVGVRYKGNSSLYSAYNSGNGKLPLRFKFDKFEDDYTEIKNQRFYGFQHLSMNSNFNDNSFMREKTAVDLFSDFGVPAVQSAFYEVYVDEGDGNPVYYGLYTMDEVVQDTFLESEFGSDSGNCYKPVGDGAKFSTSGFSLGDFEKKTNEDEDDFSDIQALYDALHSSNRTTDIEAYKIALESVFDVQGFLKYLAVNNTIQNWDTYANMTHNYYLYHDPADDLIKWIVWDNNEAFGEGKGQNGAVSLGMDEVSADWPLIAYLIDIEEYMGDYQAYLVDFNNNYYVPSDMAIIYDSFESLISSSVASESSGFTNLSGSFSSAVSEIKAHCATRNSAISSYINK